MMLVPVERAYPEVDSRYYIDETGQLYTNRGAQKMPNTNIDDGFIVDDLILKSGETKRMKRDWMVFRAFKKRPSFIQCILHIDDVRTNNHIDNLACSEMGVSYGLRYEGKHYNDKVFMVSGTVSVDQDAKPFRTFPEFMMDVTAFGTTEYGIVTGPVPSIDNVGILRKEQAVKAKGAKVDSTINAINKFSMDKAIAYYNGNYKHHWGGMTPEALWCICEDLERGVLSTTQIVEKYNKNRRGDEKISIYTVRQIRAKGRILSESEKAAADPTDDD